MKQFITVVILLALPFAAHAFSGGPPPLVERYQPFIYSPGAADPNNDSLSYELIQPRAAASAGPASCVTSDPLSPVPFQSAGYNLTNNPFAAGHAIGLNPVTGQISFTPADTGRIAIAIRTLEWRNGVRNGSAAGVQRYFRHYRQPLRPVGGPDRPAGSFLQQYLLPDRRGSRPAADG